jgi:predicted TIM-barrel fold metal-dependent hydrolase
LQDRKTMPYVEGQTIHDADSHIMEAPDFLDGYLAAAYRDRVDVRRWFGGPSNLLRDSMNSQRRRHDDPGWRAESAEKIMLRKNYDAIGSWRREDRPAALGFDPLWATAQEAGLPILFHVGGGGQLLSPDYFKNGLPLVPDFHGGDGNFRSIDYMAIPSPPMQTLGALIFDRVLDRFPRLKFGVIEQGASWLPGWMRSLDTAHSAFLKNEERLQKLSLKPSEFVRRQVRVTPYPAEDTGWIIANSSAEICMFSSDYPHVEGGRNPLKRFGASMANSSDLKNRRFYRDNFVDLMGAGLPPGLR